MRGREGQGWEEGEEKEEMRKNTGEGRKKEGRTLKLYFKCEIHQEYKAIFKAQCSEQLQEAERSWNYHKAGQVPQTCTSLVTQRKSQKLPITLRKCCASLMKLYFSPKMGK